MALTATIYKMNLQITDLDRNYYESHQLTLAKHPSETSERMMVRVAAFLLNASDGLQLCKGLSDEDEPALWEKELTGEIRLWIEVGLPDEKRIRKACSRARKVVVYCYGGRTADIWWQQTGPSLARYDKLSVINLPGEETRALADIEQRTLQLQCTLQDGQVWLTADGQELQLTPVAWKAASNDND